MLELSDKDFRQPSLKFFNKHLQMKKLRKEIENIQNQLEIIQLKNKIIGIKKNTEWISSKAQGI